MMSEENTTESNIAENNVDEVNTSTSTPARDPNTIYVGKKPVMNYVLACLTVLQNGSTSITIKARGRTISTAVDVSQILIKRFDKTISVSNIQVGTEQVSNDDGQTNNVSSIVIELSNFSAN